jgi:hypothetical protein
MTRLVVDDSSLCLINCHLAAGQDHVRARNADLAAIFENKDAFAEGKHHRSGTGADATVAYVNGGDGTMVLDHEIVFVGLPSPVH